MDQQIDSVILHARNAPIEPAKRISRDNVLDTIDRAFESNSIVFLEGEPLSGKSELAAQYMRRNEGRAVGAFLTPTAPIFYSAEFLRLTLVEQIHLLVRGTDALPVDELQISEPVFNQYVLRFQSLGRKSPITFVIDGLSDSERIDRHHTLEIFDQLPAVQSEFRFLITGSDKLFQELSLTRKGAVKIPRFTLSPPETADYLSDLNLAESDVRALHTYSSGNVGILHKLRLLLAEGTSLDELLAERKGSISKIFEYEWNALQLDSFGEKLLGFVAFSYAPLTSIALGELTQRDASEIESCLKRCRLVENDTASGKWSIRSDAQRRFVTEKLEYLRKDIEGNLISRLVGQADERESTVSLPAQLIAAEQHGEVLQRLTGAHFSRLLAHEKSLRVLKTHAEYGIVSARENDDIYAELRFSLIESTINGTTLAASSTYEIEALLALGLEDEAAALALAATTAEERLRHLAAAARCFAKLGKEPPEQILVTMRALLTELEDELPEPVLITIAAELLPVDIDLSLQLLEKASISPHKKSDVRSTAEQAGRDAINATDTASEGPTSRFEAATKLRPVLDAAAVIVRKMTAQEVLRRIADLEERHKLFLLQRWLEAHRRNPEAAKVALAALDIVLRETSRSPKIKDIREIAVVAPHIVDRELSERVIARLDAQSSELIAHGTSEEAVRLKMSLLRAKHRWNPGTIDGDLIDLFYRVHGVTDVGIRTACYAWMLYHLSHLDGKEQVDHRTGVIAETTRLLMEAIDVLLSQTADHYVAAVDAIRALCMCDPNRAVELVARINTEARRNRGYALIVRCIATNKTYNDYAAVLVECINRVTDPADQEKLTVFLLDRIATHLGAKSDIPVEPRLLILWKSVTHPARKLQAQILTFRITRMCAFLVPNDSLMQGAEKSWNAVDLGWLRIDLGYWTVSQLAIVEKELAQAWLEKVRLEATTSAAPSYMAGLQLFFVADLAGRVFAHHVAASSFEYDRAIARLSGLVAQLPDLADQALTWTRIGVLLWFRGKRDLSQRVVAEMLEPLLDANFEHNQPLHEEIVSCAAPLLYLTSAAAANARLDQVLSASAKDDVRNSICVALLRKMLPSDFYQERERTEFELSYAEAVDVLSQIRLMSSDWAIYANVSRLCNSLAARKNRESIRRNQVADILTNLKKIVEEKLPDVNNIKHEGFLIACLAEILRCQISETKQRDNGQWQNLLDRTSSITNSADRVIVISMIASCANGNGPFADGKWFDAIREDILDIPSDRDRIERFQWVAEILEPFDRNKCRVILKDAMLASSHLSDDGVINKRQRILDLAHNIDPSFVNEVIDIIDDDPATQFHKRLLKDHSKLLDSKKEAATDVARLSLDGHSVGELTEIACRSLSSLNAGRQIPQSTKDFMQLIEVSKRYPFPLVFPVWLWVVESGLRKATQQMAQKVLPKMFECICSAGEVAVSLFANSGGGVRSSLFGHGDMVGPGSREQLFARLKAWAVLQPDRTIHISDPYFGPDDLEVIKAIAEVAPDKQIIVVTSREQVTKSVKGAMPEEVFRESWDNLCEGDPPDTEIVVVGFGPEGKHPIHDRWIVSRTGGLRLGTSPNSIGLVRISEISDMDSAQADEKLGAIELVLDRSTRHWDGQKLHRTRFFL